MAEDAAKKKARWRAWYAKNRDRVLANNRSYYRRHAEKLRGRSTRYSRENPDRQRDWAYRKKYGITLAEARAILTSQGGRCPGCLRALPFPHRLTHVDHDHLTGRVRGILCKDCNHALPRKMTPATLRRLAAYLERSTM